MAQITVNGKNYNLPKFDAKLLGAMYEWAKARIPDPLVKIAAVLKDLPAEIAAELARSAYQRSLEPLAVDDPQIIAVQATPEGVLHLLTLLLSRHQEVTEDEVWEFHTSALAEHGEHYLEKFGVIPEQKKKS